MSAVPVSSQQLGRFSIVQVLGQGSQGKVYLAQDPRLDRQVALKTWKADSPREHGTQMAALMDQVRLVSRLSHPNIAALHDAFEDRGQACLVFEYVAGETLAQRLSREGTLAPTEAARIVMDVCHAVAAAHAGGVIHGNLKPGNIMLTAVGVTRVMDFGIANCMRGALPGDQELVGTRAYLAPEYIATRRPAPSNDLFALGMVLYEMLTGGTAPDPIPAASSLNSACDDHLNSIVMKLLEKDPARRYQGSVEAQEALQDYLNLTAAPELGQVSDATLAFLLRRMRHKSDFPALSSTLSTINQAVNDEKEPVSVLCNDILKDFALTNKLLKLVNAACFTQFGGDICTVSRAVALIGFEGVRNAALSLMLFEHLQHHPQAGALKDEIIATYFTGMLARNLAVETGLRQDEEACICAMFHRLGQLVTTFYLPEEDAAIKRLSAGGDMRLEQAAREVLGMSIEDLGIGVAKSWNFPGNILASMRTMREASVSKESMAAEPLRVLSSLACDLCDAARALDPAMLSTRLDAAHRKYANAIGLDRKQLEAVLLAAAETLRADQELRISADNRAQLFPALRVLGTGVAAKTAANDNAATLRSGNAAGVETVLTSSATLPAFDSLGGPNPGSRAAVLTAGIQDITHTLVGDYALFDVMRIILEVLFRGQGFQRTLLFIREPNGQSLRCRFGFGDAVDALTRTRLAIPLENGRDIFSAALQKGVDICIENLDDPRMQSHLPDWYRQAVSAKGVVLFPMMLNRRAVGLIYADTATPDSLCFSPEELNLIKTLRNQALLALKQRTVA